MLVGSLPAWDLERRPGVGAPLVGWTLAAIHALGSRAPTLERLHEVVDARGAHDLAVRLEREVTTAAGREVVASTLRRALPELPWEHIALRTMPRFRVRVPGDAERPLPLHTDHEAGRELDERNVWIALTRARGSACLRAASLVDSLSFAPGDCPTRPLEVDAGDVLLFTPLHLHGSTTVLGEESRLSLDVRLGPA